MRNFVLALLAFLPCSIAFAQLKNKEDMESVSHFVSLVKRGEWEILSKEIYYPLQRQAPIPPINNAAEFLKRRAEVFDKKLISEIIHSSIRNDWTHMGWRGIMLKQGALWLEEDGFLIGVNAHSEAEMARKTMLIAKDKARLHPSLKHYRKPVVLLQAGKYLVRIDEISDWKFRYAAWKGKKDQSDKPDIIIEEGVKNWQGTGGSFDITFTNGVFKYICYVWYMRAEDEAPAILKVYKGEEEIMSQDATILQWFE